MPMNTINLSVDAQGIALLELNRPENLNALSLELVAELIAALEQLAARDDVKALILTGVGRAFCAGADLGSNSLGAGGEGSVGEQVAETMRQAFNPMMEALYDFPRPVITAVNGIAAGGGVGLALCADIVLASETAALKVVQVPQLGIVADLGANWLLQRISGRSRAMALCLLGDTIRAAEARQLGLVWECVPGDELIERAREIGTRLGAVSTATLKATRQLVDEAPHKSFAGSIEDERLFQRELCDAPVFMESVSRFMGRT